MDKYRLSNLYRNPLQWWDARLNGTESSVVEVSTHRSVPKSAGYSNTCYITFDPVEKSITYNFYKEGSAYGTPKDSFCLSMVYDDESHTVSYFFSFFNGVDWTYSSRGVQSLSEDNALNSITSSIFSFLEELPMVDTLSSVRGATKGYRVDSFVEPIFACEKRHLAVILPGASRYQGYRSR